MPNPRLLSLALIATALSVQQAHAVCEPGRPPAPDLLVTADKVTPVLERRRVTLETARDGSMEANLWSAPTTFNPQLRPSAVPYAVDGTTQGCWRIGTVTLPIEITEARLVVAEGLEPGSCLERAVRLGAETAHRATLALYETMLRSAGPRMMQDMAGFGWVTARGRANVEAQIAAWIAAHISLFAAPISAFAVASATAGAETGQKLAQAVCPNYNHELAQFLQGGNRHLAPTLRRGRLMVRCRG